MDIKNSKYTARDNTLQISMLYGKILFKVTIQGETEGEMWNGGWQFIKIYAVVFWIMTQCSLVHSHQQIWWTHCSIYTEDRQLTVWISGYPSTSLHAVIIQEHTVFIFSMEVRPQIWRQQVPPNNLKPPTHVTNRRAQHKLRRFLPYNMLWKTLLVLSLHNSISGSKSLKLNMQSTVLLSLTVIWNKSIYIKKRQQQLC